MVNRRLPVRSCRSAYRSEVSATAGGAGTSACANPGSPDYALPRKEPQNGYPPKQYSNKTTRSA